MHVTTLRGQVGQGACAVGREAGGAVASGTRCGTVSVEGALVLLLYVSLITELIAIARGRYCYVRNDNSHRKGRPLRPIMRGKKSCGVCREKKSIRSLDNLWRRMQKATNQMRLVNLRHHMITKVMMEARIQAREREREKLHQKKEKLFAGIFKPLQKTVRGVRRKLD